MNEDYGKVKVTVNGEEKALSLRQYPYVENDARYDYDGDESTPPTRAYHAHAVDAEGREYMVTWVTRSDFWHYYAEEGRWLPEDDEGNACDWDNPVSVREA